MTISLFDRVENTVRKGDKRAMMALDHSPESFSPKMDSTSLFLRFQLLTHRVGPVLIPYKIDKGLQGDATYQKSMLYPFQFQRRRILKLVFFLPMFQLVTPGVGSVFTQRNHMNKIDKGPQRDAKYQISKLSSFKFQRRILKLVFFVPMFQLVTLGAGPVLTPQVSYEQTW